MTDKLRVSILSRSNSLKIKDVQEEDRLKEVECQGWFPTAGSCRRRRGEAREAQKPDYKRPGRPYR